MADPVFATATPGRPSYALVIDIEKTGCDMIRNSMVSFGVVLMNLTGGFSPAPPANFCAEFTANMPWGFGELKNGDWAIAQVTEEQKNDQPRGRDVAIGGWLWEVECLQSFWNYKNLHNNENAIGNRRRMLQSCLEGGHVEFRDYSAIDGGMQGSRDQPLENNQIMRAFGRWLSGFHDVVKKNLIILSDNPAFDVATINYYMAQARLLPLEKFFGGYNRVVCTSSFHKGLGQQYFDEKVWGSEDAAYDFYKSSNVSLMMSSNFDAYKEKTCPFVHDHHPLNDAKSIAWDFWLFRTLTRDSQRK